MDNFSYNIYIYILHRNITQVYIHSSFFFFAFNLMVFSRVYAWKSLVI